MNLGTECAVESVSARSGIDDFVVRLSLVLTRVRLERYFLYFF